jgi:diphosphomevalonate decarboxylase
MDDIQTHFVKNILADVPIRLKDTGSAFAPANIALCKYWGKRDTELNLPVNSSLSVSLGRLGTHTWIRPAEADTVKLQGQTLAPENPFAARIMEFLRHFRPYLKGMHLEVRTENSIPTAAGLASSASGFAALVMALNDLAGWGLDGKALSMLARLGSGSAARSVYDGFVQWHAGTRSDGSDSFAERIPHDWPQFRIGIIELSSAPKPVGSRDGMKRTVETSVLYQSWPPQAGADLESIRSAIEREDFPQLGRTAERNALAMHATMQAAWPPLIYMLPDTLEIIHTVQRVRADGLELYLTIDAGPNIKLLFLEENEKSVVGAFSGIQIVSPFA